MVKRMKLLAILAAAALASGCLNAERPAGVAADGLPATLDQRVELDGKVESSKDGFVPDQTPSNLDGICVYIGEEICSNGIDDDCDGKVDEKPGCWEKVVSYKLGSPSSGIYHNYGTGGITYRGWTQPDGTISTAVGPTGLTNAAWFKGVRWIENIDPGLTLPLR